MKNVLYVGNALSSKGKTTTSVESLGLRLGEFCCVKIASGKSNKLLRLLDMMRLVISNRKSADVVLIDTYSTTNFYYALVIGQLSRWFNIKYIPILHGGNLEHRLKHNPKMSKWLFKHAYKLVSPSNFLKTIFNNYGYNNVTFIPNTIDIKDFDFQNRDINIIKLLWVRSFSEIYNPEMAVLVLEHLIKHGYKAQLTMVGPESDGALAKTKLLAKSKNLNINFTGKLTREEWVNLSKGNNIFINTTNYDNTPVSVIEAMALGLPIVSTNVGGIPFLIKDEVNALLVAQNDADAMAKAIIRLQNHKDLKDKLVLQARTKAEQFNWDVVRSKWESLLT